MCIVGWLRFAWAAETRLHWLWSDKLQPTERFTSRVESYRLHRPGYPGEIVALFEKECGLQRDSVIVDIAAGTGLLSGIFLEQGYSVLAVEPNDAMREACRSLTEEFPKLTCLAGTAEAAGLRDSSVNLITVAQAMHWFDLERARSEFVRILAPGGWCAILYNNRCMGGDAFHDGYEKILRDFGSDYEAVRQRHLSKSRLADFFAPDAMRMTVFANAQELTLEALEGRILSSSYMPQPGHPRYEPMRAAIEKIFDAEQRNGRVRLEYDCAVAYGQLTKSALDDVQG
jgi:SAM-dependent methyltransferase